MEATPPPELAAYALRTTQLEKTVNDLSCDLRTLRSHIDGRFIEQRAHFDAQLFAAMEKLNTRMDSQTYMIIGIQVAVFLALVALVATS